MKTIKLSTLKRKSFCNAKDMPQKVIMGGKVMEWVAIGWVDNGPATEEDQAKYPKVVD